MYLIIKKFCKEEDIVFLLSKDSVVIGKQSLNILNSVYQAPDVSYAKSGMLFRRS